MSPRHSLQVSPHPGLQTHGTPLSLHQEHYQGSLKAAENLGLPLAQQCCVSKGPFRAGLAVWQLRGLAKFILWWLVQPTVLLAQSGSGH